MMKTVLPENPLLRTGQFFIFLDARRQDLTERFWAKVIYRGLSVDLILLTWYLAQYLKLIPLAFVGRCPIWLANNMIKPSEIKKTRHSVFLNL